MMQEKFTEEQIHEIIHQWPIGKRIPVPNTIYPQLAFLDRMSKSMNYIHRLIIDKKSEFEELNDLFGESEEGVTKRKNLIKKTIQKAFQDDPFSAIVSTQLHCDHPLMGIFRSVMPPERIMGMFIWALVFEYLHKTDNMTYEVWDCLQMRLDEKNSAITIVGHDFKDHCDPSEDDGMEIPDFLPPEFLQEFGDD